jgi:hypothetical protein
MKSFCMFVDFSPLRLVRQFLFDYFSDCFFFRFRHWPPNVENFEGTHGPKTWNRETKILMISRKDSPKKIEQPASEIIY